MNSTVPSKQEQAKPIVRRTERGLSISGSRITIYDVMDYYGQKLEQYDGDPLGYVRDSLPVLSEEAIQAAGRYIEAHKAEVELEYQAVLKRAEEIEQYWRAHEKEWRSKIVPKPLTPERAALLKKVEAHKAKLAKMRKMDESSN